MKFDFDGAEFTEFMMRLFIEDGQLSLAIKKEIVQKIKEKACYISLNLEDKLNLFKPYVYELPHEMKLW